jgi:beta-lactamase regulating signal transducer with metallopeptidase domain
MLAWMAYATLAAAVLGLAAWLAEKSADAGRGSARWLWSLAILASLLLPLAMTFVSIQAPMEKAAAPAAIPLREMTSRALAPAEWATAASRNLPAPLDLDRTLAVGWVAGSGLLLLGLAVQGALVHRAKRSWRPARVAGVEVLVSDTVGPALVGLVKPRIVVPAWVETAPAEVQALIIAHERTHLDADDALLLAVAVLLIVCMPWNLPLWWQLHRLRFAIEADCDARVLRGGGEAGRYGQTLLMVAERHVSGLAVVAAMSEPKSNLEKRLRKMLSKPKKAAWLAAAALAGLSLAAVAVAAEVSPPAPAAETRQIKLDAKTLENYVGFYGMDGRAVMTISRDGDQLSAQFTGQPAAPIFPKARTEFFYKIVKAELSFEPGAEGPASALVLHQGGADIRMARVAKAEADRINAAAAARFRDQAAAPGTDKAVRAFVSSVMAGRPDYGLMTPELAKVSRPQEGKIDEFMKGLGPVRSIAFAGVGPGGNDVYTVRHEKGVSRWIIGLAPDGKISTAAVTPGP